MHRNGKLSQENTEVKYIINKEASICEKCNLLCSYCKICIHTYSCTCIDAQIKMNMCKHIHAVQRCTANEGSQEKESEKTVINNIQESEFSKFN